MFEIIRSSEIDSVILNFTKGRSIFIRPNIYSCAQTHVKINFYSGIWSAMLKLKCIMSVIKKQYKLAISVSGQEHKMISRI